MVNVTTPAPNQPYALRFRAQAAQCESPINTSTCALIHPVDIPFCKKFAFYTYYALLVDSCITCTGMMPTPSYANSSGVPTPGFDSLASSSSTGWQNSSAGELPAPDTPMGRHPQETRYWSNQQTHSQDSQQLAPISNTPQPDHWCTIAYYELDQQVCQ